MYPTITPVNSFRVVFNNYFGTDYPLLDDIAYHAGRIADYTSENMVKNECVVSP
ncbi:MAG: hypothetical protein U0X93_05055 [Anaerolineales bacterium]